jgi:phytanoyl-CoA hydroxylase
MVDVLNNNQVAQFEATGYLSLPDLLTCDEIEELRGRTADIAEGRITSFPAEYIEYEPGKKGIRELSAVRKLNSCASVDAVFRRFSGHQAILDLIQPLLGLDIKLFGSQAFMKPPGGVEKPYHQDSPYFSIEPMALVTCWIALDDVTLENGCLWVIPGSHRLGPLSHSEPWIVGDRQDMRVPESEVDVSQEVAITIPAGGCSLHHSLILHRSLPNHTQGSRRGLAYHYMSAESHWTDPDKPQPEFPLLRGRSYPGCV